MAKARYPSTYRQLRRYDYGALYLSRTRAHRRSCQQISDRAVER
jgi:hypothetical protein